MITPCVNECKLVNGFCVGCRRSTEQISNWIYYTDEQRQQIIEKLFSNEKTHIGDQRRLP
jgi:predicted Fe-S protein YdhL (DUF1289 family)